jgi:hypothetical protein
MDNPLRHPPGVPRVEKPRAEGQFHLADGRRLGYAGSTAPSARGANSWPKAGVRPKTSAYE